MQWSAEHDTYVDERGFPPRRPDRPSAAGVIGRALAFVAIFSVLQLTWEGLRGGSFEYLVVHHGTVRPAAFLANALTPQIHVEPIEFSLRAAGGGLRILNGCEGIEALFLLTAAFLVVRMPWQARLPGLCIGLPLIFGINQLRILSLFYAYRADPQLFNTLHSIVAPIVVVLLVALYFYSWLNHGQRRQSAKPA